MLTLFPFLGVFSMKFEFLCLYNEDFYFVA